MRSALRFIIQLLPAFAVIAFSFASAADADDWMLTTSDLHSRSVTLRGIDQNGVQINAATTQPSTVDLKDFLSLDRVTVVASTPSRWIAQLRNGDKLAGDPDSLDGDNLHWRESLLGPMTLPMSEVVSLHRGAADSGNEPARKRTTNLDDVVKLNNGDVVHGVITDLNARSVSVQRSDNSTIPVPIESVSEVQFASTAMTSTVTASTAPDAATASLYRFDLLDGSRISSNDVQVQPPTASIAFGGQHRQVALETIQSIEQIDGPVTWLSDLSPTEDVQLPLLGPTFPNRFNRTVMGQPLRFSDQLFRHGIGVHAYSRMSWKIDPRDQAFRTQFAIDGDAPYADVTVRIKLDGEVASEIRDVRSGELRPVMFLDVRGKHTITLEVEDTLNDDVQARLNWLEPAFLREIDPTTATINAATTNTSSGR